MSSGYTTRRRVARKARHCSGCRGVGINVGDAYLEHTEFPGGDAGYASHAGHPVRMAECVFCATRYGRDYLVEPIPESQQARYIEGIYQRGLV